MPVILALERRRYEDHWDLLVSHSSKSANAEFMRNSLFKKIIIMYTMIMEDI